VIPLGGNNESSKWNLTGTSEFTDSTQEVVNGGQQLHRLDEFIGHKIQNLVDDTRGDADRVFLSALRELRGKKSFDPLSVWIFFSTRRAIF
jgi:hypothetical protein